MDEVRTSLVPDNIYHALKKGNWVSCRARLAPDTVGIIFGLVGRVRFCGDVGLFT